MIILLTRAESMIRSGAKKLRFYSYYDPPRPVLRAFPSLDLDTARSEPALGPGGLLLLRVRASGSEHDMMMPSLRGLSRRKEKSRGGAKRQDANALFSVGRHSDSMAKRPQRIEASSRKAEQA